VFYSLQKGEAAAQAAHPPAGMKLVDFTAELKNFADTAALIGQLDLVLSTDTAVPHLAAALGKPTWILLRYAPDWRWLLGRDDSPWYPTARLFRQPRPGEWAEPIERMARELRAFRRKPKA
jgi:ADP-heptose:LPS heptosyltransferase